MGGHEVDPHLQRRVEAMVEQGMQEQRENELNQMLGGAVDLGATETCQVCTETYVKRLPGLDICGACQAAMAIVMNWQQVMYFRWKVWPVKD
jgi:hypothetical protein